MDVDRSLTADEQELLAVWRRWRAGSLARFGPRFTAWRFETDIGFLRWLAERLEDDSAKERTIVREAAAWRRAHCPPAILADAMELARAYRAAGGAAEGGSA